MAGINFDKDVPSSSVIGVLNAFTIRVTRGELLVEEHDARTQPLLRLFVPVRSIVISVSDSRKKRDSGVVYTCNVGGKRERERMSESERVRETHTEATTGCVAAQGLTNREAKLPSTPSDYEPIS